MKGSASALEGIFLVFPLDRWLHDLILNAKRNEEAAKIPTISFAEIKVLREKNSKSQRLINSIDDLLNLLLSMLTEYELLLQGDTPGVVDLWNTQIPIRPKSEEDLSNHLSRFLKLAMGSGIVINREVQIRHKLFKGGKPGSRTDLWVQAIDKAQQVLTICIEVKCNWNSTAKSALQDQLVDKYMSGGTADAGVLVLGWYSCPKWDMTDNRQSLSTATWIDANSARSDIENQSIQIRKTGYNVTASVINCSMV